MTSEDLHRLAGRVGDPGFRSIAALAAAGASATAPATLDQAIEATFVGEQTSLSRLFPVDSRDLHELFGTEDESLVSVHTQLAENIDPETEDIMPAGSVSFSNHYGRSTWIMASNYRDPALADFHASDVIAHQADVARTTDGPRRLVQRMIRSADADVFFARHDFAHMDPMTPTQFEAFMTGTDNGRMSSRVLSARGLRAVSAGC